MKSKVILFCVLLFCSKFVDSVPHSEELVRQRAFQPTNWPANNYAAGQYVDTNFAQTQNENVLKNSGLQLENNQDYYANQRTRGFESQGYKKGLSSSLLGKERLLNYAPSIEEERVNSYPIRSSSYPSSAPQIGLDNQQFRFQNWRPQNQYANPAPIQEVIPINDRPLVTTVQEPYRGPVQYAKPQFIPPVNRRHHSVDRFYPAREQLQYPIDNIGLPGSVSTKYVQNSAPVSVVRESVPYDNYGNNQGIAAANTAGVVSSKQFHASESASPYNGAPDVISSEVLAEQSRNNGYEANQSSQSDSANTADVATLDNGSQDVAAAESYNTENRPSTLLPVDNKGEAASIIQKVLADKPLVHRYANNYRQGSNWNNYAREGSYNGASVSKTNTFEIHSGNANNNYGSKFVPKKPASVNTYSKPASSHAEATSNLGHKNAEAVPQNTANTPAPLENTDSENNFYRQLTSGIHKYDLKNIASHPKIKDLLAVNNKPYVLIHANGSVEYFDKFDIDAKENSKYRLIHTKHTPSGKPQGAQGDKVLKPQSTSFIPASTTTPAPSQLSNAGISKPLPSSNEWTDDSSYLSKPADDKTSQLSPLYRKHHDADYSTSPYSHVKLPAGNDDSKTTFSNVNQPQDDTHPKTLVSIESHSSNGDQPDQNENFKPTASDDNLNSDNVNNTDDDSTPKPLVSDSQSSNTEDSKPGFASANQSNKSDNGNDDTKSSPDKVNQPDDHSTPNPQSLDHGKQAPKEKTTGDNDDDLPSISNVKQPDDNSTPKPVPSQNKQIVSGDDSKPVSAKDNQSDNDKSKNPQSLKKNQPGDDDFSSANVKRSDDNSNTKPQSSKDNKSPNSDDSKPFSSDDNKSDNGDDNKPQKHSPKHNQPNDDDDESSSKSNVNGKNDQSTKKDSKPFSSDDSKLDKGDDNKPQKPSPKDNQPDDDDDDLSPKSNVNDKNDQSSKGDSKSSSSDDNKSNYGDDNKPQKHSLKDNQPDADSDDSSSKSNVNGKNDQSVKEDSKPFSSDDNKSDNGDDYKPQKNSPKDNQPDTDSDDSSSTSNVNGQNDQSSSKKDNLSSNHDDSNSSPSKASQSQDDNNSNANDSPVDDKNPKSTTLSSSKTDDNPTSTTSSPVAFDEINSTVQSTPRNKENSFASTTASPDVTTEDQIITLSPIETATDNVSDAPSTTTAAPNKSHPRFHIGTPKSSNKDNAQDDSTTSSKDSDKKQTSTQESQSSSASQSDNISDSNKSVVQKNNESTVSQTENEKNDSKTAMYNSLTNTDAPAESDDNSPVTPSILIDVSTGDDVNNSTPGDKSLESEQSETDVKITVSTIDDSEDDIIAITIEVSESAGDADSSSDDKSVVIKINTNDSDSADSKTSNSNDFEKNQSNKDENTNQNLEIDVTNIEGEPTMWVRTTNQDFIEKLASKNDTQFDVIYFFNMNPQPTIEREKVTTIHCNGTVVIEKTETSYASQDDKTPKVVKTTTVLQIEDYEP